MFLRDVVTVLEAIAPTRDAETWDNVGLLAGDPDAPAAAVVCCLTLTPAVAAEAVALGAGLVVAHHPVLFKGVKRLTPDTPDGRVGLLYDAESPNTALRTVALLRRDGGRWRVQPEATTVWDDLPAKSWRAFATALAKGRGR